MNFRVMRRRRGSAGIVLGSMILLAAPGVRADPMCRAVSAAFTLADALGVAHDTVLAQACSSGALAPADGPAGTPAERLRIAVNASTYAAPSPATVAPPWLAAPPSEAGAWVAVGVGATMQASVTQAALQISAQVNVSIGPTPGGNGAGIDMGAIIVGSLAPQLQVAGQFADAQGTHVLVRLDQSALQQNAGAIANAAYTEMDEALRRFSQSLASRRITQVDRELLGQSLAHVGALTRSDVGRAGAATFEGFWSYYRRLGERALGCASLVEGVYEAEDPSLPKQNVVSGTFPTLLTETRMRATMRCGEAVLSGVPFDLAIEGGLGTPTRGLRTGVDGSIAVDVSGIHGNGRVTLQLTPLVADLPGRNFLSTAPHPAPATAAFTSTRAADYSLTVTGVDADEAAAVREAVAAFSERRWNARPVRGTSAVLTGTFQVTFTPAVRVAAQYSQPVAAVFVLSSSQGRAFERSLRGAALGATPEVARTLALQQLLTTLQRP